MASLSRDTPYRAKNGYEVDGMEALIERSRKKPNLHNRVDPPVEEAVLAISLEDSSLGQKRTPNELRELGVFISPAGIRGVWLRHGLEKFEKRLKSLEAHVAQTGAVLTEDQLRAMDRAKDEKTAWGEIETEHVGYLGSQDTFYVGTLNGVDRIYQQSFIDTYSAVGFAKLYMKKHPINSADMLNDRVIPFFEDHGVVLLRMLTDRDTEYCGKPDTHEYQLFLALNDIEHTKTNTRHLQTNGICERFNKTCLNEFYQDAFRKKIYESLDALQEDPDAWIEKYNTRRTHQGKRCLGRTPMATFLENLPAARAKLDLDGRGCPAAAS